MLFCLFTFDQIKIIHYNNIVSGKHTLKNGTEMRSIMADRVTIQDIADALGISRNTVSKALNNTGILADATREKVLNKAIEMGYKQFSYITTLSLPQITSPEKTTKAGEIALLTTRFLGASHFSSTMVDKFQREISQLGYSLTMHRVLDDEIRDQRLPLSLNPENTSGIICFEMFERAYSDMICRQDIPALFVDSPVLATSGALKADCLYMDNQSGIFTFVREMVRRGRKKIGFIGEYMHCQSFWERYMAYRNAMFLLGLPCPEEYCITSNKPGILNSSSTDYKEYLSGCFRKLESLPDVFICANDFIAFDVLRVFRELGISVPKDVYLCGFDDSPESKIVTPSLTTIRIHSQVMGFSAVHLLMSRIREPSLNYRTMHTETSLIYRESTEN